MPNPPLREPKFFYSLSSVLLLVLTFAGFHFFYLQGQAYPGRPLTPPIRMLLILHGVSMTAWMIVFAVQAFLIAGSHRRLHMALGRGAAVLAALVAYSGVRISLAAAAVNPPEVVLWSFNPRQFLAISLSAAVLFGLFVAAGIWKRKVPAFHRPVLFLGTLVAVALAIDRIEAIKHFFESSPYGHLLGPYWPPLVLGAALFLIKWAMTRAFDRVYAAGLAVIFVWGAVFMALAPTPAWASFANRLLGA